MVLDISRVLLEEKSIGSKRFEMMINSCTCTRVRERAEDQSLWPLQADRIPIPVSSRATRIRMPWIIRVDPHSLV